MIGWWSDGIVRRAYLGKSQMFLSLSEDRNTSKGAGSSLHRSGNSSEVECQARSNDSGRIGKYNQYPLRNTAEWCSSNIGQSATEFVIYYRA